MKTIILIGLLLLTPISKAPAQMLWSLQNHPPNEAAFGLCLALFPEFNELTGGIEYGLAKNHKLAISGGLGFFKIQNRHLPPAFTAKFESMRLTPLNKEGFNFFTIGNLGMATVEDIFAYGVTGAFGIMNRIQGTNPEVAFTPFVRFSTRFGWVTQGRRTEYDNQLEGQVGFEIELIPNASMMASLVFDVRGEASPGVLLSYNIH
ncbi:hypothetical protein C6499_19185 [Candidatus Poribacteria bacterium]|nr:MAG: hypothetical protein C6499_19185 [Candidatus Poribacteria bacterium]